MLKIEHNATAVQVLYAKQQSSKDAVACGVQTECRSVRDFRQHPGAQDAQGARSRY